MSNTRTLPFQGSDVDLEYNGYRFYETSKCSVKATPVYQEDEITVKHINYSISIHALVTVNDQLSGIDGGASREPSADTYPLFDPNAETTTDINLADLRKTLTKPGAVLKFKNLGMGKVVVGGRNSRLAVGDSDLNLFLIDVDNGPKPRMLTWEPIGSNQTARIVWTVEFSIPECYDVTETIPQRYPGIFSSYTYTESFSYDMDGYLTRTIEGRVEVPHSFKLLQQDGMDIPVVAQGMSTELYKLRNLFLPKALQWCKRTAATFTVAANKKSATFSVKDVEVKSDYELFPSITHIDATHSITSSNENSGAILGFNWSNTFNLTLRLHKNVARTDSGRNYAWLVFLRMLDERLGEAYRTAQLDSIPFVTKLNIEHNLTSPEFSFSCSWTLYSPAREDLFKRVAFFNTGDKLGLSEPTWKVSILPYDDNKLPGDLSGYADNLLNPNIVTICNTGVIPNAGDTSLSRTQNVPGIGTIPNIFGSKCPDNQQAIVSYRNNFQVAGIRQLATNYTLQDPDPLTDSDGSGTADLGRPNLDKSHEKGTTVAEGNVIIQRMGNSRVRVVMWGEAFSYNQPVQVPSLVSFGGKKAVFVSETLNPGMLVTENPCPLYKTSWVKTYELVDFPEDTKPQGKAVINGLDQGTSNPQDPSQNQNSVDRDGGPEFSAPIIRIN